MRIHSAVRIALGLAIACMMLVATGCQNVAERAAEEIVEDATGINVEDDGDKVTIETEDGSVSVQDGGAGLPDGFPGEVLVYEADITGSSAVSSAGETIFSVTQETADSFDDVVTWYRESYGSAGWTESGYTATDMGDSKAAFVGMSKGSTEVMVNVAEEEESGVTMIMSVRKAD